MGCRDAIFSDLCISGGNYTRQISLQSSGSAATLADFADAIQVGIVHDVQISLPGLDLTHRNLVVVELKMPTGLHVCVRFCSDQDDLNRYSYAWAGRLPPRQWRG